MKKKKLSVRNLISCAKAFCTQESTINRAELYGITDGKAIGTFVEHAFQKYLEERYDTEIGSSANGLDLPSIQTDIKVTSIRQPQSSCPYKDSKQKIYGLGYNLIIFVYDKIDNDNLKTGRLNFVACSYIDASRTADYQTTTGIHNIIKNKGNEDDILAFLYDHKIPADDVTLQNLAQSIIQNPPKIGYLTISNALQWRLQYQRIVMLQEKVSGITSIVTYAGKK